MIGLVRAFAWLRWRLFLNAFKSGRKDSLERISRAGAAIVPVILGVAMIPGMIGAAGAGLWAGWALASQPDMRSPILLAIRLVLASQMVVVVLAPMIRMIKGPDTGFARLLLLPVPTRLLFLIDFLAGLADPWVLLPLSGLLFLPAGFFLAGRWAASAAALAAGALFLVTVLSLSSLVSTFLQWVFRSRRRGEALTFVVLVAMVIGSQIPLMVTTAQRRGGWGREAGTATRPQDAQGKPDLPEGGSDVRGDTPDVQARGGPEAGGAKDGTEIDRGNDAEISGKNGVEAGAGTTVKRRAGHDDRAADTLVRSGSVPAGSRFLQAASALAGFLPSEMYGSALFRAEGGAGPVSIPLGGLLLAAAGLCACSWAAYRRMLEAPVSGGSGSAKGALRITAPRLAGVSPAATAVAWAEIRAYGRTVQGRMTLYLGPLLGAAMAVALANIPRGPLAALKSASGGAVLAWMGAFMCLMGVQKLMMNQFAVDGAGLSLQFLAPVVDREIVAGKALAGAVFFAGPMLAGTLLVAIFCWGGPPLAWAAGLLAGGAAYVLIAPVGAILSAVFPKTVTLGFGKGSNPSSLASLFGMFAMVIAIAPPVGLMFAGVLFMKSFTIGFALVLLWAGVAAACSIPLYRAAARVLALRRENLVMVAEGR